MSEAEVKAFVGERCEEILQEVAEILGVKSPEEVLEAVQGSALRCLRCKELGGHADYCMVAANLARGVPAFWAPWAMWAFPPEEDGRALYVCIRDNVERLPALEDEGTWLFDGLHVDRVEGDGRPDSGWHAGGAAQPDRCLRARPGRRAHLRGHPRGSKSPTVDGPQRSRGSTSQRSE